MIKKMRVYLENNLILKVVLAVFFAIAVSLIWKYTLYIATDALPTINSINEQHVYETYYVIKELDNNLFEHTALGTMYHAPAGSDTGPFKFCI